MPTPRPIWRDRLPRRGSLGELALLMLVALLGCAFVVSVFHPGFMSVDSIVQLTEARSGRYTDAHPPLMALLWRALDRVVPGPFGMLLLMNVLYWVGLALFFRARPWPLGAKVVGLLVVGGFPPLFGLLGTIWKDMLMQAALLVGMAALAGIRPRRGALVGAGLAGLAFSLAVGVRHNAAAAVWPLVMVALTELPTLRRRAPALRLAFAAAGALIVTAALHLAVSHMMRPLVVRETHYFQTAPIFDLTGMSLQTGKILVPREAAVLREGATLAEIRRVYTPINHLNLYKQQVDGDVLFRRTHDPERLHVLTRAWVAAIRAYPGAYVRHRVLVSVPLLGFGPRGPKFCPIHRGIERNALGVVLPPSRWREGVLAKLCQVPRTSFGVLYRLWVYALASLLMLPLALRSAVLGGSPWPLALLLSGLGYLATYCVLTGSPDFRYGAWTMLTCLLACVCTPELRWRS